MYKEALESIGEGFEDFLACYLMWDCGRMGGILCAMAVRVERIKGWHRISDLLNGCGDEGRDGGF